MEECIQSVLKQTVKSQVYIATSTTNKYVMDMTTKYELHVFVNVGEKGIAADWNFVVSCTGSMRSPLLPWY